MGLVTCGECGKEVSNVAKYCPSCGFTAGKYVGKSKGLAVVLALFLGGLGIHKFYLGKIWLGFLYLIFCWTFIPVILGVIDAIVLATKNEREFSGAVVTAKAPKNAEALSPAKAPKNEPKQGSGSLQNPKMREDLRSALEMAGFHRRVILSKGIQANEHIPDDAKVLCALLTEDGMQLLLNTGILRLELKKTRAVAELIPFTALSKASVRKSLGTSYVDIQTLKSHPGVLSGFTPKSENAYRFEELYSNINPLAAKKTKLREDFARAKGYGPDHVPDDLDIAMESYIPEDSEVLYLIGDLGVFMLLDTGVLRLKLKLFGGPISGSEFVPLAQIKGVTVKDRNPGYAVEVRREEGSVVIAGSSFKTSDFFGLTGSKDEALKFQKMLLALLGSPSSNPKSSENAVGKISQLKELLDAGAITQDEFDAKKKKLMDSI
jgi:TM2 domain-containing membrane protein YozV